jgi:hypothetical protein
VDAGDARLAQGHAALARLEGRLGEIEARVTSGRRWRRARPGGSVRRNEIYENWSRS